MRAWLGLMGTVSHVETWLAETWHVVVPAYTYGNPHSLLHPQWQRIVLEHALPALTTAASTRRPDCVGFAAAQ